MGANAQARLLGLLTERPAQPDVRAGYLDLLGGAAQAGPSTGLVQRLMRTSVVPTIYEHYWRPALGRVIKGVRGPSMAGEREFAVAHLGLPEGGIVLDVACGTGAFTRAFGTAVGSDGLSVGLDGSATMLARAVPATPADAPVAFLRADAARPPLRAGSFDGICCFAALHLFSEPEVALSSFARLLRPGGRLVLMASARRGWQPARTAESVFGRLSGIRMFDRGELGELLRGRGFADVLERYAGETQFVAAQKTR
ncbi:MAG: methyltransferase domain-containing protein [Pseudonocardiaceae bacterium]|nr:methyltransferase domain-containing protein [Pseudonocardiaceae bacterium]